MNLNGTWQQPALEQIPEADVPHPSTYAKVEIREMTDWMYSDDAQPVPKSTEKSVKCCVAEEIIYDDYDMVKSCMPFVRHRYYDEKQKKWSSDIASSVLKAGNYLNNRTQDRVTPGLKDRFGTAIAAYQNRLVRDGRDLPLVLLSDKVYPQVIDACECKEITSINALAGATKATINKVKQYLRQIGQTRMAENIEHFQEIAKSRLDELGVTDKQAA